MKITSSTFISSIKFDYFKTYSFNRINPHDSSEENISGISEANKYDVYVLDKNYELSSSARLISTINASSNDSQELLRILNINIQEELRFLCAPIYRDAILFFNASHELVGGLNICFECDRIVDLNNIYISTDFMAFKYLKLFLLKLGHNIEQPTYFHADDVLAFAKKNKK